MKQQQLLLWSVVNHEVNMPSHPSPCIMIRRIVRHFSLANQLRVKCVPSVCLCRAFLSFLCFHFSCLADCIPSIMLNWREYSFPLCHASTSDLRTRCRHQHKRTAFPHNRLHGPVPPHPPFPSLHRTLPSPFTDGVSCEMRCARGAVRAVG